MGGQLFLRAEGFRAERVIYGTADESGEDSYRFAFRAAKVES